MGFKHNHPPLGYAGLLKDLDCNSLHVPKIQSAMEIIGRNLFMVLSKAEVKDSALPSGL